MPLQSFTSFDEVRAVLAVAEQELPDRVIGLAMYERLLSFELADIHANIEADYLALAAVDYNTLTTVQKLFFDVMQVFSAFSVARQLVGSQPMFAPKVISATDVSQQREDPYEATKQHVLSGYNVMLARLKAAYLGVGGGSTTTSTAMVFATAVGIAADPVTDT